jgi:long-chain acyl-CoA synthetase
MLNQNFAHYARQSPNQLALVTADGRHWSRGELQLESELLTHGIEQQGLTRGDRVVLALPNCAEFVALVLALESIGCEIDALDVTDPGPIHAKAAGKDLQAPSLLIGHERFGTVASAIKSSLDLTPKQSYSLGTISGFSRYQRLRSPHPGKLDDERATARRGDSRLAAFGVKPQDNNVYYCALPLAQSQVWVWVLESLHYGHVVVLANDWAAEKMLHDIELYRVTNSHMLPAQFKRLLALPPAVARAYDTGSMRQVICTQTPCPANLSREMIKWWDIALYEGEGSNRPDPASGPPQEAGRYSL